VDIASVIADLCNRLDNVNQAILALEKMSTSWPRQRGRPRTRFHSRSKTGNTAGMKTSLHSKTMAVSGS
jgi:hypothetical protein